MYIEKIIALISFIFLIKPSTVSYSTAIASKLVKLSAATYDKNANTNWVCTNCDPDLKEIEILDFQKQKMRVIIGYDIALHSVLLSFRGSQNIKNWITDLKGIKCKYQLCNNCQVHNGFATLYRQISDRIRQKISQKLKQKGGKLLITGHSLGGALASLAALNLCLQLSLSKEQVLVYTYGQPRVGNKAFAQYYSKLVPQHYRVVNQNDIVPHLAPMSPTWKICLLNFSRVEDSYIHPGYEVWYKNDDFSQYEICIGDHPKCSMSSIHIFNLNVSPHYMNNYLKLGIISKEKEKNQTYHQKKECVQQLKDLEAKKVDQQIQKNIES